MATSLAMAQKKDRPYPETEGDVSYPIQKDADFTPSIDGRLLATQLSYFAQDANCLVGELIKDGLRDTWSCF